MIGRICRESALERGSTVLGGSGSLNMVVVINNTTIITFVKITTNTTTIIIIDRAQRQCSSNMVGIVIIIIYNVIIIIYSVIIIIYNIIITIYSVIIIIITIITGDMDGAVENEKTGIRKGGNCSQMMPPYDAAVLTMVSQPQRLVNFVASREIKALGSKFEKIYLSQAFCGTLIA